MPLVASLPGCIVLLAGFVIAILIGVSRIGIWKTALVWGVMAGLTAAAIALGLWLRKKREI